MQFGDGVASEPVETTLLCVRRGTCEKFSEGLQSVFGVSTAEDDMCIHPHQCAGSCYEIIIKN